MVLLQYCTYFLSPLSLSHTHSHTHTHTHTTHTTHNTQDLVGAGATEGRGGSTDIAHYLFTEVAQDGHKSGPKPQI